MNVIFVLWGTKYNSDQLELIFSELKQYGPDHSYYCFTDQDINIPGINVIPIPPKLHLFGVWNKLHMFAKEFPLEGKTMYFDIDTVIVDNPFKQNIDWNYLNIIYNRDKDDDLIRLTNYDVKINSSVMAWDRDNEATHELWNHFEHSGLRDYFLRKYVGIDRFIVHEGFTHLLNYWPADFTWSYKYQEQHEAPIVTFEELDFGSGDFRQRLKAN